MILPGWLRQVGRAVAARRSSTSAAVDKRVRLVCAVAEANGNAECVPMDTGPARHEEGSTVAGGREVRADTVDLRFTPYRVTGWAVIAWPFVACGAWMTVKERSPRRRNLACFRLVV